MSGASQPSFAALGGDVEVSFEFFPPKGEAGEAALFEAADALAPYRPRFFSVTYGAGGSTRDRSLALVERLEQATGIPVAAHLTCVAADKQEIADVASAIWAAGSRHIVARGRGRLEAQDDRRHGEEQQQGEAAEDCASGGFHQCWIFSEAARRGSRTG